MERKGENTARMTRKRANETQEETVERKGENTTRMTRKRDSRRDSGEKRRKYCQNEKNES